MKTAVIYAHNFMNKPHISLPNAATRRQLLEKFLDRLLIGVCCVGLAIALLFLSLLA